VLDAGSWLSRSLGPQALSTRVTCLT
jgi:hypothetical protein